MSADRYSVCPVCRARAQDRVKDAVKTRDDSYGNVPLDQYRVLEQKVQDAKSKVTALTGSGQDMMHRTFREDWEFEIPEDGEVAWTYSGACSVCGAYGTGKGTIPVVPAGGTS